jgi:hypothetical protein
MATCLLSLCGLLVRIHSYFASLVIKIEYSCLNTCLYTLCNTLISNSCIAFHASLGLCLMNSLPRRGGGEIVHKVGLTLANRVVER